MVRRHNPHSLSTLHITAHGLCSLLTLCRLSDVGCVSHKVASNTLILMPLFERVQSEER